MTRRPTLPTSFRGRFLLVVFFAAVVPLALIGAWLTRSVVRAGEDLLRSELDQSLEKISAPVATRWSYRRGDLGLLANNEVATRVLAGVPSAALTPGDADYLGQLFASVSQTIPAFEYRDATGGVRWSSAAAPLDTADARGQGAAPDAIDAQGQRAAQSAIGPTMAVRLPIASATEGARLGDVVAQVSLAALIPIDSSIRLPNGARLQAVQRDTGWSLLPAFAPHSLLGQTRFTVMNVEWLAVHRTLADPEIDLTGSLRVARNGRSPRRRLDLGPVAWGGHAG